MSIVVQSTGMIIMSIELNFNTQIWPAISTLSVIIAIPMYISALGYIGLIYLGILLLAFTLFPFMCEDGTEVTF